MRQSSEPGERQLPWVMIYVGLLISLLGIAVVFVTLWLFVFGLAVKLAGVVFGSALVYVGWHLTERGDLTSVLNVRRLVWVVGIVFLLASLLWLQATGFS
jgi:hypothetical protein